MTLTAPPRLIITVFGRPITQGSKTNTRYGGMRDANAKTLKPWRDAVTTEAEDATRYTDTITAPVRVWIRFTFNRPTSHYRTGRNGHLLKDQAPLFPTAKNDIDKLQRACFDALTDAHVWGDDGQVIDVRARKFWAGEHEYALPRAGVQLILEEVA